MQTQKELSKESKSTQEPVTQKETTRASGEKSSNETLTQAKEYTNLIDDFLYQYDLKDDLWFLKYAKLQNAHNRDEVGAALKNWHEVRDNVSTTYDDYVAATEKVKNSLNRAALDIIDDFKATDEAFEAIEKIQTKLLDDYPQTNKNISINTKLEKDSMQIESKSTQEPVTQKETQENTQAINQSEGIREQNQHLHLENLDTTRFFETINNMQGKNLSKKDKIQLFDSFTSALQSRQDLIIDEIERILKHANKSGDRKYKDFSDLDKYAMKEIFFKLKNKDLYDDYESILKALKANKDIDWDKSIFKEFQNTEKGIALSNNKISSGVAEDFAKSLKEWELDNNHIVNKFKDTIQSQKIKDTHANTKQHTNTTNHTEKETSTKESHTDNKHEATQRENGADTEWITTRTSNNPQENKDTETTLKRDNGISDEYSPSTKEMAQSGNEKTHEKRDIRDDSSHSSSDTETNANISRDTQGHNAGIRLDETDNKRYKHDGNDDRTNSRTRIHRNVSLKKKGKKDSNTNIESKVATQDIDTQSTPQVKPKKLTDKEVIDNFLKEYDNGSKELAALKEVKNPGIMQDLAKYIKQFDESKRLQDNIRKLDSNNELTQIDFVEWYKGALKEVAKGSEDSFVYSVNGYLKKLREENNYLDWKAAQEIQTTPKDTQEKDVSLNAQHDKELPANIHDKETPKTTKEIIKEAKASGKSVAETKELLQKHKDIESKRKETQKLITQEKEAKEKLHKEIGIFEKEKQNALEKLESIKTQINELEKKDLSSKQAQKQMDKLQTNLSFFANEIEKTRNLIKQRKDKLATTQEVYIPQNHTFSYDGREFNTREHFSILKQRSLNNQDDDFNGFDTLMREAIENALNIKPIKEFGTNYAEHYHSSETAIQKLINEAQAHKESGAKGEYKGQVAGAFHRKELGDIDLVWGEVTDFEKHKGYRLTHILDKHPEFDVFNIPKVIEQGKIEKTYNGYNIVTDDYIVGLNKGFKDKEGNIINDSNVWVVTSFEPQAKLKKGS